MITVAILINGNPLVARSATNVTKKMQGIQRYKVDDGTIIEHRYEDGAVELAKKMLDTIKEEGCPYCGSTIDGHTCRGKL